MSNQKTILTFGIHRSGTSLTANILSQIGVNMGSRLMKADADNPEGYFENWDFVNLNNEILRNAGGAWNYPPNEEAILKQKDRMSEQVKQIILENGSELWGWKDNRTMLTFPVYEPHLQNRNLHIILTYRKREDVIASLKYPSFLEMFHEKHKNEDYLNWLADEHYRRIEKYAVNKYPILKVQFEKFFTDDEEIKKILKFVFGKIDSELLAKAKAVVNSKIKHL